jgi:hypothetical protein
MTTTATEKTSTEAAAILDALTDLDALIREARQRDDAPESTLLALLRRGSLDTREFAASHGAATPKVLAVAARDRVWSVRLIAARHADTPPDALAGMVHDRSEKVLKAMVRHPSTPLEARSEAILSAAPEVQRAAAVTPLTHRALDALTRSRDRSVRKAVATNPGLPEDLAHLLAADREPSVRQALARTTVIESVLLRLADDTRAVSMEVAGNPATTLDALERCVGHADPVVRRRVARRPRLPGGLLQRLAEDPRPTVRAAVARREHLGPYRGHFVTDPNPHVRRALATTEHIPQEELDLLCRDEVSLVRHIALQHPRVGVAFVREAAAHPDVRVRRTVRKRLDDRGEPVRRLDARSVRSGDLAEQLLWAETERDQRHLAAAIADPTTPVVVCRTILQRIPLHDAVFEAAAGSSSAIVRRDAAAHVDCPPHVLERLLTDEDRWVRGRAVRAAPSRR